MTQRLFRSGSDAANRSPMLVLLSRSLVMANNEPVVGGLDSYLGRRIVVHHARPAFRLLPERRLEETRWGVCTATPPDLPGGRAVGSRKSLRGFWGREARNSLGAVDWYFARAVSDMRIPQSGAWVKG